jgi:hypothetical protein
MDKQKLIQTYDEALETVNAIPEDNSEDELQDVRRFLYVNGNKTE